MAVPIDSRGTGALFAIVGHCRQCFTKVGTGQHAFSVCVLLDGIHGSMQLLVGPCGPGLSGHGDRLSELVVSQLAYYNSWATCVWGWPPHACLRVLNSGGGRLDDYATAKVSGHVPRS